MEYQSSNTPPDGFIIKTNSSNISFEEKALNVEEKKKEDPEIELEQIMQKYSNTMNDQTTNLSLKKVKDANAVRVASKGVVEIDIED